MQAATFFHTFPVMSSWYLPCVLRHSNAGTEKGLTQAIALGFLFTQTWRSSPKSEEKKKQNKQRTIIPPPNAVRQVRFSWHPPGPHLIR